MRMFYRLVADCYDIAAEAVAAVGIVLRRAGRPRVRRNVRGRPA
ncbi:hypothetical protein [Actinomycetospora atypica]|uniref:Uncharacterized protein n=1 Tax=Actinomycetospora atypica TaxID=1290095 RepID=A0ABV9YRE6_9PSEU